MSSSPLPADRVLVIDDDRVACESVCAYLDDSGFTTCAAHSGRAGLAAFGEFKPHVVVCDLRMPDLDGLDVIKALLQRSAQLPIIVLSGAGGISDVLAALRLGARDYLVKPIADLVNLERAILGALGRDMEPGDEIASQVELEAEHAELAAHLQRLGADAEALRQAGLQLFPPPQGRIGELDIAHRQWASRNAMGDFLDYFPIDDRVCGFYMADTRPCGPEPTLLIMALKSQFNALLRRLRERGDRTVCSPDRVLAELNRELAEMGMGRGLCLAYGVIDGTAEQLRYASAGYFSGIVLAAEGDDGRHARILEAGAGLPLGSMEWASYGLAVHELPARYQLAMPSLGLVEHFDGDTPARKLGNLAEFCAEQAIEPDGVQRRMMRRRAGSAVQDAALLVVSRR